MDPEDFRQAAKDAEVLDVRTPGEFEAGHIAGARNIDMYDADFLDTIKSLDRGKPYALYCRSGSRSGMAVQLMEQLGFEAVGHLEGGLLDWDGELQQ
jgi:rhodanese-related sulfurtransferase